MPRTLVFLFCTPPHSITTSNSRLRPILCKLNSTPQTQLLKRKKMAHIIWSLYLCLSVCLSVCLSLFLSLSQCIVKTIPVLKLYQIDVKKSAITHVHHYRHIPRVDETPVWTRNYIYSYSPEQKSFLFEHFFFVPTKKFFSPNDILFVRTKNLFCSNKLLFIELSLPP